MNVLKNKRILICGKGGSGKSSIVTLLANEIVKQNYKVILLDADASNPGGLFHLLTNNGKTPKPLIDFFGGRQKVTCPVDDPSPLTRKNDKVPINEAAIKLSEIPKQYSVKKKNLTLFQIGKIKKAYEGCDGPMQKVARDFIVKDDFVTLIDMEAGIEHFGRGIEKNVDIIIVIVDPTFESVIIAEIVKRMAGLMGNKNVFAILNKVDSKETDLMMQNSLKKKRVSYIGSINFDKDIQKAGLEGKMISKCKAEKQIARIIKRLENIFEIKNL